MPTRRRTPPLPVQFAELAVAVPQVIAHRSARLALAGPRPSPRDRREFSRMSNEKGLAFVEGGMALWWHGLLAQQRLVLAMWQAALAGTPATGASLLGALNAGLGVLGHGMAPVHRRAVANSRRLRRTPLK